MMSYGDRTYCASPECLGKCNRELTDEVRRGARKVGLPISVGYFCGLPDFLKVLADKNAINEPEKDAE